MIKSRFSDGLRGTCSHLLMKKHELAIVTYGEEGLLYLRKSQEGLFWR